MVGHGTTNKLKPTLSRTRRFGSVKDTVIQGLRGAEAVQSYAEIYAAVDRALDGS
jgi:hypothetical protein